MTALEAVRRLILAPSLVLLLLGCEALPSRSSGALPGDLSVANPVLSSLTGLLDVSPRQAIGGVGAMLSLARSRLSSSEFRQVAGIIPEADRFLAGAGELGVVSAPITDQAGLEQAFAKIDIGPGTMPSFLAAVIDFVGDLGGEAAGQSFARVFT